MEVVVKTLYLNMNVHTHIHTHVHTHTNSVWAQRHMLVILALEWQEDQEFKDRDWTT